MQFSTGAIGSSLAVILLITSRRQHKWHYFYTFFMALSLTDLSLYFFIYPVATTRYVSKYKWSMPEWVLSLVKKTCKQQLETTSSHRPYHLVRLCWVFVFAIASRRKMEEILPWIILVPRLPRTGAEDKSLFHDVRNNRPSPCLCHLLP